MANINKAIIVGYLGRDADKRFTASGEPVTTVSIATTDKWRDRSTGETRENTEWHRITFFGKLAEIAGQYLKKGSLVYVEGKLRTRKYSDRDGIERTVTEIIGDVMQMLGDKENRQGSSSGSGQQQNTGYKPNQNQNQAPYDDIPF